MNPKVIQAACAHAQSTYPDECCGLVLADAAGGQRFVAIANVAGTGRAAGTSTRTAQDGYVMDPKSLLAALETGHLVAIVHSHPDVGAYFSREDRDMALGGGDQPLWPGVQYLVISLRDGIVDDARIFTWDASSVDFNEIQVPVI